MDVITSFGENDTANSDHKALLDLVPNHWDSVYWVRWHQRNWTICFWFVASYLFSMRLGVKYMAHRKAFRVRPLLALWNSSLAAFSLAGSINMVPEMIVTLAREGLHGSACNNRFADNPTIVFWSWLFVWSKVFEFGDTAFIVLRKQRLSFLHWYHHSMTVICVFVFFPGGLPINLWTGAVNYSIHIIMYSYYTLRSLQVTLPKMIPLTITTLQIVQMILGFYIALYELYIKLNGQPCRVSLGQAIFSFFVYFSYFLLFVNFYVRTYLRRKPSCHHKTD